MNSTNKFLTSAAIALAAMTISANANANMEAGAGKEKCYGVAKIGANDCASKANGHGCAGKATVSGSADEFVLVPTGLCEKLNNGTLKGDTAKK